MSKNLQLIKVIFYFKKNLTKLSWNQFSHIACKHMNCLFLMVFLLTVFTNINRLD